MKEISGVSFIVSGQLPPEYFQAAIRAQLFLDSYLGVILGVVAFTQTKDRPEQVFNRLASFSAELTVTGYTHWNPWTSEVARATKDGFKFNMRRASGRDVHDLVNTYCHETAHKAGYTHSFRNNADRPYSVPYLVGTLAEKWSREHFVRSVNVVE